MFMKHTGSLLEETVVATIRLEYLKLAVVVVLVIIIAWCVYTQVRCSPKDSQSSVPAEHLKLRIPDPVMHTSTVPQQSAAVEDAEHFAPYASWLAPDIYRSDPAHDENISNDSHYGMYAPYNLDYLFPANIDISGRSRSNDESYGTGPPEHLVTYNQHNPDTDAVAGEVDVPERQLESDAGLLFGLSNDDTAPFSSQGPL